MMSENITTRKPGRPKKNASRANLPRGGIVPFPSDPELVIELKYENPMMFKKIFTLFKNASAGDVTIVFDREMITLYAIDHLEKNNYRVKIYGARMHSYYCESRLAMNISMVEFKKPFLNLTTDYTCIEFLVRKLTRTSRLTVVFWNEQLKERSQYTIDFNDNTRIDDRIEETLAEEPDYPISFTLPTRTLKRKISDYKMLCTILRFEKSGSGPLSFVYSFNNHRGSCHSDFKEPDAIALQSTIAEGDIFAVSVKIDYLSIAAHSPLSETVRIATHQREPIICTFLLDEDEDTEKNKVLDSQCGEVKIIIDIVDLEKQ